jgi:hypothetical protein
VSAYDVITDGPIVAFDSNLGFGVTVVDLAPNHALCEPWTEECEGCGGTGVAHACDPLPGPCASCWGVGRVLFAFHVGDRLAASCVPPVVAAPYIAGLVKAA